MGVVKVKGYFIIFLVEPYSKSLSTPHEVEKKERKGSLIVVFKFLESGVFIAQMGNAEV